MDLVTAKFTQQPRDYQKELHKTTVYCVIILFKY
jgi:hypothetical protein